jgi:hypothetical protein
MIDRIKHICSMSVRWYHLVCFFCRISSMECKLEDAKRKCEMLMEDVTDGALKTDLRAISYRIEYAYLRMRSVRERGTDLIMFEDGDGL